jgi:hypothetical protein
MVSFGNVPHPPFEDRLIPDAQNLAWDGLGPRRVYGVVQHTMVTSLWGCDSYFHSGAAAGGLTDYGIGGASDGSDDGLILLWNDPTGAPHPGVSPHRWPWASGPCQNSSGDAVAFINAYGPNAVNGYLVSIERSDGGDPNCPASNKYLDSFIALTAYWADYGRIPYDQYPANPNSGCWSYFWHAEINGGKTCPAGAKASTDEIQAEVTKVLQAAQTGTQPGEPDEEEDVLADFPKSDLVLQSSAIWPKYGTGKVSKAWAEYGSRTGVFNPPGQPWGSDPEQDGDVYCFAGGPCFDKEGKLIVNVQ